MNRPGAITMTMRELDRLKIFQSLADGNFKPKLAAKRLGLTTRQVLRLSNRFKDEGAAGLIPRSCNRPSNNQTPIDVAKMAITIIRERYADFGPTFACEKLRELHGLCLSKETV
jgi:hypothetical protein